MQYTRTDRTQLHLGMCKIKIWTWVQIWSWFTNDIDLEAKTEYGCQTALHLPVGKNTSTDKQLEIVRLLLDARANIEAKTGCLDSTLAVDALASCCVPLLVNRGVDLNLTTVMGYTPMHLFWERHASASLIEFLLDEGAGANAKTHCGNGYFAIHLACQHPESVLVVRLLLDR